MKIVVKIVVINFGMKNQTNVSRNVHKDILRVLMGNVKNAMIIAFNVKDEANVKFVTPKLIFICMKKMECVMMNLNK